MPDDNKGLNKYTLTDKDADYLVDLMNTEVQALEECIRTFPDVKTTSQADEYIRLCQEKTHAMALYQKLQAGDWSAPTDSWRVHTMVIAPNETAGTSFENTYDNEPTIIAIETPDSSSPEHWLRGDMGKEYNYWKAMFGGYEFNVINTKKEGTSNNDETSTSVPE